MNCSSEIVAKSLEARALHDMAAHVRSIEKQCAELLEALKMVQEAAFDMRGEDFNLTTEQWSIFHAAIANAEK